MKPKSLTRPLVAGCTKGHKPRFLHVCGWDMDKKSKCTPNVFFSKKVSFTLMFVQVHIFPVRCCFKNILELTGDWSSMWISWTNHHTTTQSPGGFYRLCATWKHSYPRNFLASFLDSGRKWRHVIHLYLQSMSTTQMDVPRLAKLSVHTHAVVIDSKRSQIYRKASVSWKYLVILLFKAPSVYLLLVLFAVFSFPCAEND